MFVVDRMPTKCMPAGTLYPSSWNFVLSSSTDLDLAEDPGTPGSFTPVMFPNPPAAFGSYARFSKPLTLTLGIKLGSYVSSGKND